MPDKIATMLFQYFSYLFFVFSHSLLPVRAFPTKKLSYKKVLKLTVIGLIAAAAVLLVSPETFGTYSESPLQFFLSIGLFAAAFFASLKWKTSPILLIVLAGVVGFVVYYGLGG